MKRNNLTPASKRQHRVRSKVISVASRPRLAIHRSNQHISAQIIGLDGQAICGFTSESLKKTKGTKSEIAVIVGDKIAELAKAKKITELVLDRGSYRFHGRVKSLVEAVRKSGINL